MREIFVVSYTHLAQCVQGQIQFHGDLNCVNYQEHIITYHRILRLAAIRSRVLPRMLQ